MHEEDMTPPFEENLDECFELDIRISSGEKDTIESKPSADFLCLGTFAPIGVVDQTPCTGGC